MKIILFVFNICISFNLNNKLEDLEIIKMFSEKIKQL